MSVVDCKCNLININMRIDVNMVIIISHMSICSDMVTRVLLYNTLCIVVM